MIDRDLARLYNVETRLLNQKVKRNLNRFPEDFCFQMTNLEFINWKSQIVISNSDKISLRKNPYVFTEQGIAMLSAIINSDIAVEMSIKIMNAFVQMRKFINKNINMLTELNEIKSLTIKNTNEIKLLQESFDKLESKEKINHIFFSGQIYDSYSLLVDILKEAKEEIIIIDNYIDKTILDITCLLDKKVIIVTNKYNNIDIEKYKKQYNNLSIKIDNKFHDRFLILDRKILYHCAASFKDIGSKCFSINKIEDEEYLCSLIKKI
jgi:hypothetical protein